MDKFFFELIQVAIGSRQRLSRTPREREWSELYGMAAKHALVGVCFAAIQRLNLSDSSELTETLHLRWLGMAAKIQQRSRGVTEECVRLVKQLTHDGFHCCILKGQSNLVYYPEDLRECRTAGDIDVLLRHKDDLGSIALPIRYCLGQATMRGKRAHVTYHHADLFWEGQTEVEAHYRATFLCSPLRNWRLQRWFRDNEQWGLEDAKIDGCVFPVATVSFNAVYQLLHIYKHLFESGIGLRQLLDYYFVLRALHVEQCSLQDRTRSMAQWAEGMGLSVASNIEIMHQLRSFGLAKFAGAVMYVLREVFGMPEEYMICPANEKEGRFLLNEIMMAGNFGKYDDRIKRETPSIPRPLWLPCIGEKRARGKKVPQQLWHAWEKLKHNMRLVRHYPEEVMWEPAFRVYHWIWRKLELWKTL